MAKGSSFEREITKKLSLWYTDGKRDDIFYRTAGSGARATTRFKSGKATENSAGDIGYLDAIGKPFCDYFMLELKRGYTKKKRMDYERIASACGDKKALKRAVTANRGKGIDVLDFLDSNGSVLLSDWFDKAETEAYQAGKKCVLIIFQRDGKKPCVMMPQTNFSYFCSYMGEHNEYLWIFNKYVIITLEKFFDWFDIEILHSLLGQKRKLRLKSWG
jgi:hypothetical protein